MTMHALIENKPEGKYTASLIGWPDITAQGSTENEVLSFLRCSLSAHPSGSKVIPLAGGVERP